MPKCRCGQRSSACDGWDLPAWLSVADEYTPPSVALLVLRLSSLSVKQSYDGIPAARWVRGFFLYEEDEQ